MPHVHAMNSPICAAGASSLHRLMQWMDASKAAGIRVPDVTLLSKALNPYSAQEHGFSFRMRVIQGAKTLRRLSSYDHGPFWF